MFTYNVEYLGQSQPEQFESLRVFCNTLESYITDRNILELKLKVTMTVKEVGYFQEYTTSPSTVFQYKDDKVMLKKYLKHVINDLHVSVMKTYTSYGLG